MWVVLQVCCFKYESNFKYGIKSKEEEEEKSQAKNNKIWLWWVKSKAVSIFT